MYLITASKFLRQKLKELHREMGLFILIIVRNFSTRLSIMARGRRKKISTDIDG